MSHRYEYRNKQCLTCNMSLFFSLYRISICRFDIYFVKRLQILYLYKLCRTLEVCCKSSWTCLPGLVFFMWITDCAEKWNDMKLLRMFKLRSTTWIVFLTKSFTYFLFHILIKFVITFIKEKLYFWNNHMNIFNTAVLKN